ncbi:MAG TPA: MFS transporter, partial [Pseudolysinimonas sp.]|nr:MFS transporter [Pseudolysinimonas sp.]
FTLSTAVGSPLGTAIAAATDWRVPLFGVAGLAVLLLPVLALLVRGVPTAAPISLGRRFAVLKDSRILLPLIATLLVVAGFNIVYIFSSAVTGFQGTPLAILLLVYGLFGVVGNMMAGPLTDRFGSRTIATVFFALEGAALLALVFIGGAFLPIVIVFAVWGVSAFAATVPLQHRLVAVDHQTAAVAISWFSTALYIGIATAPLLGSAAIATGDVALVPLIGTVVTGLALIAFQLGFALRSRRTGRPAPATLGA